MPHPIFHISDKLRKIDEEIDTLIAPQMESLESWNPETQGCFFLERSTYCRLYYLMVMKNELYSMIGGKFNHPGPQPRVLEFYNRFGAIRVETRIDEEDGN